MTGTTRFNNPGGSEPADADDRPLRANVGKVRELQRKLWAAAQQSAGRRFHALYDRIYRDDVLVEAWERVRANRGAAGIDRVTLAVVEDYGVDRMLRELRRDLQRGVYRPSPVRRVGFRPKRSATEALEKIRVSFPRGRQFVFEADIRDFFGTIDHDRLLSLVGERVSDRRVLKRLRAWLRAGVMANGAVLETVTGAPQGGVISPLLANIYLHAFDRAWDQHGTGELVRYAG